MKGRKPGAPKVQDVPAKLHVIETPAREDAPGWIKDERARAEWARLLPQLKRRHQYLDLFATELGRYCVAFGFYVQALDAMAEAKGPVTKSSKGVQMLSMWWVVANRAHETMLRLAGELGLNPVAQVRMSGLQLDMFPDGERGGSGGSGAPANPFSDLRRA